MKKVTRVEYLKAHRVVNAYLRQQQEGKYQFLYWRDQFNDEDIHELLVPGINIDDACQMFLKIMPEYVTKVDYEVMFKGEYFDITNKPGFEDLI